MVERVTATGKTRLVQVYMPVDQITAIRQFAATHDLTISQILRHGANSYMKSTTAREAAMRSVAREQAEQELTAA
jgi:hypothetical protein